MSIAGTTNQREGARRLADCRRFAASKLKRHLSSSEFHAACREAARILRDEPERIESIRVHAFFESIPHVGELAVQRLLTGPHLDGGWIWPRKRCRDLTERQRLVLAVELDRMAAHHRRVRWA